MYLLVDTSVMPPSVELCEPDGFSSFRVAVTTASHVWIDPGLLSGLMGDTADDAWEQKLAGMVAYAAGKGWLDDQGRLRAHIEINDD